MRACVAALTIAVVVAVLSGTPAGALLDGGQVAGTTDSAPMDEALRDALATAGPEDRLVAVATLPTVATAAQVVALASVGLEVVPYRVLPMAAVRGRPTEMSAAASLAFVRGLYGNRPLESALAQSREVIGAEQLHQATPSVTGRGVGIAVLDSGIDGTHPDLAFGTKTVQNVKVLGNQHVFADLVLYVEDVPNTDTTTGHGTHVAGIAAGDGAASGGLYRGVAPGAHLIGLGAADGIEMLTAVGGYDWILANHETYDIRVINNSWADGTIDYDPEHPLNRASRTAADAGIVVVFAAGNSGQRGDVFNRYAWPDWVVSVGAGTKTGQLADYSSRGNGTHHADLIAPGHFIASTMARTGFVGIPNQSPLDLTDPANPRVLAVDHMPYYTVKIGTSMAAPHVAGVVALMLEVNPDLTPAEVREILIDTATAMPVCDPRDCGAGYVNALAAVTAAGDARARPPVGALTATPQSGAAPLEVTLDATGSVPGTAAITSYRWDVDGDGVTDSTTTQPMLDHTYASGVHRPTLVVVDRDGLASAPAGGVEVRASDPPVARASAPRRTRSGTVVTFDASASSDPDGDIVAYRFLFGDGTVLETTSQVATHTYSTSRAVRLGWSVEVVDDAGLRDAVAGSILVTP